MDVVQDPGDLSDLIGPHETGMKRERPRQLPGFKPLHFRVGSRFP
jgi:hypothetical protein